MKTEESGITVRGVIKTIGVLFIAVAVAFLSGCPQDEDDDDDGVSKSDRVSRLQRDINDEDRYANAYTNWHPDTTTRNLGANPDVFGTIFPTAEIGSFEFARMDGDTYEITSNTKYGTGTTAAFTFKKHSGDYMINSLEIDGEPKLQSID